MAGKESENVMIRFKESGKDIIELPHIKQILNVEDFAGQVVAFVQDEDVYLSFVLKQDEAGSMQQALSELARYKKLLEITGKTVIFRMPDSHY